MRQSVQNTPARRCYTTIYETISGLATAEDLMRAHLETARARCDDLTARAAEISSDPYYRVDLDQAQGAVEGFTALLDVARTTPRPPLDAALRALDADGHVTAEATFNVHIETIHGADAPATATLPSPGGDPMRGRP